MSSDNKIILPAYLTSHGSRADGERLTFVTDRLTDEQILIIRALHKDSYGFLMFKGAVISDEEKDLLDNVDADMTNKTPSQRFRAVLYRNWEQDKKGYDKFKDYYSYSMETIITHYKNKLD